MGFGIKLPSKKNPYGSFGGGNSAIGKIGDPKNFTLWGAASNLGVGGKTPGGPDLGPGGSSFPMKKTEDFIKNDPAEQIGQPGAIGRRFAGMRERTGQEFNAAADTASDALKRKFSSMGASGSGAQIQLQQQNDQKLNEQKSNAFQQINQSEEDANLQRDTMQADMNFKQKVFNFERGSKMHELDLAERQAQTDSSTTEFNRRLAEFQMKPQKQGFLSSIIGDVL